MVNASCIDCNIQGDIAILKPDSNIDESNSWQLQEILRDLIDQGTVMILVDLSAVEYLSSATLGIAASIQERLSSRGGTLCFCRAGEGVRKVMYMTQLDEKITIYDIKDEAVAALQNFRKNRLKE